MKCERCEGCGKLANTEDEEPWTYWMSLPLQSAAAVTMGLVKPKPCHACGGSGEVAAAPPERGAREATDG